MAYVIQRGDRYTGYYRDRNGIRYSAGTFSSKKEAQDRADSAEANGAFGSYRLTMTLREYLQAWLPNADLLPLTKKNYESVLFTHMVPILGRKKVGEITRMEVRDALRRLAQQGVSASTRVHAKSALGSAFKELVESDLLDVNPTHKVAVKVNRQKLRNVLEPDEFKLILDKLPSEAAKLFAQFLVTSGLRFGEATELRVQDIDFPSGEVYVQRRVNDLGKNHNEGERFKVIEGTKGGRDRSVHVSLSLIQELEQYIKRNSIEYRELIFPKALVASATPAQRKEGKKAVGYRHGTRYAYTHGKCRCAECRHANAEYRRGNKPKREMFGLGEHLPRDTWRRIWVRAIEEAGLRWVPRTHDLRHANATQLLKNGVDLHEVKERLGHSSISTTERYLHRVRKSVSDAADSVVEFL